MTSLPTDDADPTPRPDEEQSGLGVEPHREAPSYDTDVEGYTGISEGALTDAEDVDDARELAEMIVDTIREGLLVLDFDHYVRAANESFYRMFGVEPEETIGRLVYDLGDGQWDLPELRDLLEGILPEDETLDGYEVEHDFEGVGRRAVLLNARRLDDHRMILLAIEDVTERKEAEEALRQSEARFRALAETVPDIVFTTTPDGVVDYVSPRREEVTGQPPESALGTRMWPELIHPEDRAYAEAERAAAYAERRPYESRYRLRTGGGAYRWFIARARPTFASAAGSPAPGSAGEVVRWFGTLTDVDALARAEEALRRVNETLEERVDARTRQVRAQERRVRELSRALALAEHAERQRIAQVLHDDLQQVLFGAQMASSTGDAERASALLAEALETTRTLSHSLSPPFLEGEDTEDLLRWVAERHRMRYGLEVEVEAGGGVPVPDPALRVLLYQLVREILFNVAKHAEIGRACVRAERMGDHIRLVVEDEGVGFDPAALEEAGGVGLGLRSVRERVELVGGRLEIESEPGAGTRVTISVPVEDGGARACHKGRVP